MTLNVKHISGAHDSGVKNILAEPDYGFKYSLGENDSRRGKKMTPK